MAQLGLHLEIKEDGEDFASNALLKARALQDVLGKMDNTLFLSDDSGLCVEALGLEPGIFSARYASHYQGLKHSTAMQNNLFLIKRLKEQHLQSSKAYFVASIVLLGNVFGKELQWSVEERCEGVVYANQKGEGGFGYDSLFEPLGWNKRMAEMTLQEKNQISHRYKALRKITAQLKDFLHV